MCSCSGVQVLTFAPDRGSTISIRSRQVNGCKVCTSSGRSQHCSTYIDVKYNTPVTVTFNCSKPEDVFNVEITRNIGKRSKRAVTGQVWFSVLTITEHLFSM